MSNHYHLALETPLPNLAAGMCYVPHWHRIKVPFLAEVPSQRLAGL